MSAIQMTLGYTCGSVELSCAFIDRFMHRCQPVYALIYIYGLRRCTCGDCALSTQDIGSVFNILETDVINAWQYWETEGLVRVEQQDGNMAVTYLPLSDRERAAVAQPKDPQQKDKQDSSLDSTVDPPLQETAKRKVFEVSKRPQYTVDELTVYREQSKEIERLFKYAENMLGKLLTYNDMNVLFGFYDWLRLPVDVIGYLLSYCAENDHRDLRYIERAALDWAEHGLITVEAAMEYVQAFDSDYKEILKAMGQTGAFPTASQKKYLHRWLHEYEMPAAIVMEACDKAALQIGRPKFTYVDKIIEDWHNKGISTIEGVKAEDERFASQKVAGEATNGKLAGKSGKSTQKTGRNRFANFTQRELDYTQMEKKEREYLMKSLKA